MSRPAQASLGTTPCMTEASGSALDAGGTAVDACIAGLFAAAGQEPAVLLGSMCLIVAGLGAGSHVFDGCVLQPGFGFRAPIGFSSASDIPPAARVPISSSVAMIAAAHVHDGHLTMASLAGYGVRVAKDQHAHARAKLIYNVGEAGVLALRGASFVHAMIDTGGRHLGGNVTPNDLAEARASLRAPLVSGGFVHPLGVRTVASDAPSFECVAIVACDSRGVLAAAHCAFDPYGPEVVPYEVVASRFAIPIRKRKPHWRPGRPIRVPLPIGLRMPKGQPCVAIAIQDILPVDWRRVDALMAGGQTLERSTQLALSGGRSSRNALAIVCEPGAAVSHTWVI